MLTRYQSYVRRDQDNGTLVTRMRLKWRHFVRDKRNAWWESQIGNREYIDIRLEAATRMRLYFDSRLSRLIYSNDFEWKERQFLKSFLRPGDVFVDLGANIGLFTLIAARQVGSTGHVYAFEPCRETYERLLTNVRLNRLANVSVHQLALSDRVGQYDMKVSLDGYDAWNSLAQPIAGGSFTVKTVNAVTWDEFSRQNKLVGRVTTMKIDVEGWESRVLLGGCETLSRMDAPVLQVEFTELAARSAGSSCPNLYHMLEDLGYQMFTYDAKYRKLIADPLRAEYPYVNLIAAKRPEQVSTRLDRGPTLQLYGELGPYRL